jgi:hypothetical protein
MVSVVIQITSLSGIARCAVVLLIGVYHRALRARGGRGDFFPVFGGKRKNKKRKKVLDKWGLRCYYLEAVSEIAFR